MHYQKPCREDFYAAVGGAVGLAIGGAAALMVAAPLAPLLLTIGAMTGGLAGFSEARHQNRMALYNTPIKVNVKGWSQPS